MCKKNLTAHSDVSSWIKILKFGLNFQQHLYFVIANSKYYGEPVHLRRLT